MNCQCEAAPPLALPQGEGEKIGFEFLPLEESAAAARKS